MGNQHGGQKLCGRSECKRERLRQASKQWWWRNRERMREYKRERAKWKKERKRQDIQFGEQLSSEWTRCHWCLTCFKIALKVCPDCNTPYNAEKDKEAAERLKLTYTGIVEKVAKRDGKDVKAAVKQASKAKDHRFLGEQSNKEVLSKITKYLNKRKTA